MLWCCPEDRKAITACLHPAILASVSTAAHNVSKWVSSVFGAHFMLIFMNKETQLLKCKVYYPLGRNYERF